MISSAVAVEFRGRCGIWLLPDGRLLKHRPVHIPGRLMRIMTRLMPRSLSVRMNGRMLGQAARTLAQRQAVPAE
jgi:hypothetical protein